jgi:hypothetical protein
MGCVMRQVDAVPVRQTTATKTAVKTPGAWHLFPYVITAQALQ